MIPQTEWKFFEATEQRVKHLHRHQAESLAAMLAGHGRLTDPAALAEKLASIVHEMDYPSRVEAALTLDPTPAEARHLDLHRRWLLGNLFATHPEIQPLLATLVEKQLTFRPRLRERDVTWSEVRRVLREESDRELREDAFDVSAALAAATAGELKELFRLRETLARAVAETGFAPVAHWTADLDRTWAVNLVDEFERSTRQTFEEAKGEALKAVEEGPLEPWDYAFAAAALDPFPAALFPADGAWGAATAAARSLGFDPDALGIRFVPADGVDDGIAVAIEIPGDVRVFAAPDDGIEFWSAVFRGMGRALHLASITARRHFLEQDAAAAVETSGALFESVLRDGAWLREATGANPEATRGHLRAARFRRLARLRRLHVLHAFENVIYAHSEVEPETLFRDVMEQTLACTRRPSSLWAVETTFVREPFRATASILAEMAAAQIARALEARFPGETRGPAAGAWLRETLIAPGASAPWGARVEAATGRALDFDALRDELGAAAFAGPAIEEAEGLSDEAVAEYFKDIDLSDLDLDT